MTTEFHEVTPVEIPIYPQYDDADFTVAEALKRAKVAIVYEPARQNYSVRDNRDGRYLYIERQWDKFETLELATIGALLWSLERLRYKIRSGLTDILDGK